MVRIEGPAVWMGRLVTAPIRRKIVQSQNPNSDVRIVERVEETSGINPDEVAWQVIRTRRPVRISRPTTRRVYWDIEIND